MTSPSRRRSPTARRHGRARPALLLLAAALASLPPRAAWRQATPRRQDKAAGVFDDDEEEAGRGEDRATAKAAAVSDRDTIGFTQENVAAQMTELEERMFRLSEALRGLEPENASRLRLALKFSREELILEPDEGDAEAPEGRPAQQGRDRGPRAAGEARTPPQPAAGRGPRLPAQAGAAPPDARDARPARADHQGRAARAGLVAVRHRAAEGPGAADGPPARPRGARPRPEGRDRRHQGRCPEGRRRRRKAARAAIREREADDPQGRRGARRRPAVRRPPASLPAAGRPPPGRRRDPPGRRPTPTRPSPPRSRPSTCSRRS